MARRLSVARRLSAPPRPPNHRRTADACEKNKEPTMPDNRKKIRRRLIRWLTPVLLAAAGLVLLALIFRVGSGETEPVKPNVGFVVLGDVHHPGWNASNYEGLLSACEKLDAHLIVRDHVAERSGECLKAVRELAAQDCKLIILASYSYPEEMRPFANEFPDVFFINMASKSYTSNMATYFPRMYQGRYMSGALAGMRSKSGVIGYVAAMPNAEVLRGINAFLLGARRINPKARVVVAWTNSWEDPERERLLTERLIREAGADFITYHQDDAAAAETADRLGVESVMYNAPIPEGPQHVLCSVNCRWDIFYHNVLRNHLKGELRVMRTSWIGVDHNAILLSSLSPEITPEIRTKLDTIRLELVNHMLIFRGPLYDNQNVLRCKADEVIGDDTLLMDMDWLISGVTSLE
ncbi:MAG: BMP family ABC transporter substrate-binding protein [Schwartzia sp.]|nr:BMP family ABC transporter substrate-binding protein [Schwartzia sp. (in: firmicutes)]